MKISRTRLAFLTMIAAGGTMLAGMFLMPSSQTFGSQTDVPREGLVEPTQPNPPAPPAAPVVQAPAPPQAPIDGTVGNAGANKAPGDAVAGAGASKLPSTGSGGYLNSERSSSLGFLLIGSGLALLGSGSIVWAYSRRRR